MHSNKRLFPTWLRFRLWELLIFTSLVAALFGVGQMVETAVADFPDAPQVSLTFAKQQIAGGNAASMQMHQVNDFVMGHVGLSTPVVVDGNEASPTRSFLVAMRESDGSVATVCELLESQGVPYSWFRSDRAFALMLPLLGTGLLTLAAIVLLRFRNRPSKQGTPISDT